MTEPEYHPFDTFYSDKVQSLIIGTFPCLDFINKQYGHWFYSTNNKNLLWPILSVVFKAPISNRHEKEKLLEMHSLAMADIAKVIQRTRPSCADTDFKIIEPNKRLLHLINRNSSLTLYFTSKTAQRWTNDFYLQEFKNAIVNLQVNLPSPSKSASRSIARTEEYKTYKNLNPLLNTLTYRIEKYSELLKITS